MKTKFAVGIIVDTANIRRILTVSGFPRLVTQKNVWHTSVVLFCHVAGYSVDPRNILLWSTSYFLLTVGCATTPRLRRQK